MRNGGGQKENEGDLNENSSREDAFPREREVIYKMK